MKQPKTRQSMAAALPISMETLQATLQATLEILQATLEILQATLETLQAIHPKPAEASRRQPKPPESSRSQPRPAEITSKNNVFPCSRTWWLSPPAHLVASHSLKLFCITLNTRTLNTEHTEECGMRNAPRPLAKAKNRV